MVYQERPASEMKNFRNLAGVTFPGRKPSVGLEDLMSFCMKILAMTTRLFAILALASLGVCLVQAAPAEGTAASATDSTNHAPALRKHRTDWDKLTPEQRESRLKDWREKQTGGHPADRHHEELKKLTPQEREAKMKEWRAKMDNGLADLRKRKAEGTISEEDNKRLTRMEEMCKRLDEKRGRLGNNPPAAAPAP